MPPTEETLWSYLVQLTAALRAAHSARRALRAPALLPSKVLLTSPGRIRVGESRRTLFSTQHLMSAVSCRPPGCAKLAPASLDTGEPSQRRAGSAQSAAKLNDAPASRGGERRARADLQVPPHAWLRQGPSP